jgi:hypothetical protein
MNRICPKCEKNKPLAEWNQGNRKGKQPYCRECTRVKDREYYQRNWEKRRQKLRERAALYREQAKEIIEEVKSGGCAICDEKEPCCLDFHHLDATQKAFNISDAVSMATSPQKLNAEISKCILVCANCHRKIHAGLVQIGEKA